MSNFNGGTITYTVKVDSSGAVTGIKKAEGQMANAGQKSGNAFSKGWTIATAALGTAVAKVTNAAMNKIASSVGDAIKRVDTFNKYPKVLSNFGISADEASASIKRIDESLKGLPITLNAGVASVQDLFFATKDLGQAEDIFKAISDSALIFTTDASAATDNFIYAYKQAMAVGKVSAQDFNQMASAIGPLMQKIADDMGISIADLREGLSKGTISIDEFNRELLKLDKEGGAGMGAMKDTAHDSVGGIETALSLLDTTITRVIGNIINKIGSGNIEGVLNNIGDAIEVVGGIVIDIVTWLSENEAVFWAMVAVLGALTVAMIAYGVATAIAAIAQNAFFWPILAIVAGIALLIAAIIWVVNNLDLLGQFFNWVGEIIGNIANAIGEFFNKVMGVISGIVQAIFNFFGGIASWVYNNVIAPMINFYVGFYSTVFGIIMNIWNTITSIFGAIANWVYQNVISPIANFFSGLWNGIQAGLNALGSGIQTVFNAIVGFIKAPINGIISAINGVIDGINSIQVPDWVPGIGGASANIGHIPMLASGGIVESTVGGRLIVAGEAGEDEWVVPESKFASLIDEIEARGARGDVYNINVSGTFATSPDERRKVADQIVEAIEMNNRRRFA